MRRPLLVSLSALATAEWACFAPFLPGMGFYADDWTIVEWGLRGATGGFPAVVKAFADTGWYWARPMMILEFPLFFAAGGTSPLGYHLSLLLLQTAASAAFFLLLRRILGSPPLAASAAFFATLYPIQSATHHWLGAGPQLYAVILTCVSLLTYETWLETRRFWRLAASLVVYAAGLLSYESCAFLVLMPAGAAAARRLAEGRGWARAGRETAADYWPYAAAFLAVQAWQWLGVRAFGGSNTKTVRLSAEHIFLSYRTAIAALGHKALRLCARTAPAVSRDIGAAYWLYWWAAVVACCGLLLRAGRPARSALRPALGAAFGGYVGAVLPYALSGTYMPSMYGIDSRTSAGLALAGGLLLAATLGVLSERPRAILTALFAGAFFWANGHTAWAWTRSYELQKAVLKVAVPHAASLPEGATLLLAGVPSHLNQRLNGIPVFNAGFDITSALRVKTGRADLKANVTNRLIFSKDGYAETQGGEVVARFSYDRTWLLWYGKGRFERLTAPPAPLPSEFTLP